MEDPMLHRRGGDKLIEAWAWEKFWRWQEPYGDEMEPNVVIESSISVSAKIFG
jgi:hypothetical protein